MTPKDFKFPPLSQECLRYIDELDIDYERDFPSEEDQRNLTLFRLITEMIFHSRLGFAGDGTQGDEIQVIEKLVEIDPDFIAKQLNDLITRRILEEIPGMTERIIKLSRLHAPRRPSKTTSVYVKEAARAYIYGFSQASVAMSRAALEQALKERLAMQGQDLFITFQDLVDEATKWKILDRDTAKLVRYTAKRADEVLHTAPTNEAGALEVLDAVRGLLERIYAADGGF